MLIGQDFDKISFDLFGYEFLELNAFIGDTLITVLSLIFAYKTYKIYKGIRQPFFFIWTVFFVVFALTFFTGGLGHLCFNYWGIPGRGVSWFLGFLAVYYCEISMLSLLKEKTRNQLIFISKMKLIFMIIGLSWMLLYANIAEDVDKGMLLPTINTSIGFVYALGVLGYIYSKTISSAFRFLYISVLILLPSLFFQVLKINIHPWFDRNDVSHILLLASLVLYYMAIKGYAFQISDRKTV